MTVRAVNKALSVRATLFHTPDLLTYLSVHSTFPHREGASLVLIHAVFGVPFYIDDASVQVDLVIQMEIDYYLAIGQSNFDESLPDVVVGRIFSSLAGMQRRVVDVVQRAAFREMPLLEGSHAHDLPAAHIENRKFRRDVHALAVDALFQKVRLVRQDVQASTYVLRAAVGIVGVLQVLVGFATLLIGVTVRNYRLIDNQTSDYGKQMHAQGFTTSWSRAH